MHAITLPRGCRIEPPESCQKYPTVPDLIIEALGRVYAEPPQVTCKSGNYTVWVAISKITSLEENKGAPPMQCPEMLRDTVEDGALPRDH